MAGQHISTGLVLKQNTASYPPGRRCSAWAAYQMCLRDRGTTCQKKQSAYPTFSTFSSPSTGRVVRGVTLRGSDVYKRQELDWVYFSTIRLMIRSRFWASVTVLFSVTKFCSMVSDVYKRQALNEDNKVSLFVRAITLETGDYEDVILNKYNTVEG